MKKFLMSLLVVVGLLGSFTGIVSADNSSKHVVKLSDSGGGW